MCVLLYCCIAIFHQSTLDWLFMFLDLEGGSQKATLVVVLLVVISSLKIAKAFLITRTQQNFAYTFVLIFPTDLPF